MRCRNHDQTLWTAAFTTDARLRNMRKRQASGITDSNLTSHGSSLLYTSKNVGGGIYVVKERKEERRNDEVLQLQNIRTC